MNPLLEHIEGQMKAFDENDYIAGGFREIEIILSRQKSADEVYRLLDDALIELTKKV